MSSRSVIARCSIKVTGLFPNRALKRRCRRRRSPMRRPRCSSDRKIEFSKHLNRNLADMQDLATQAAELGAQAMGIMAAQPPQDIAMNVSIGEQPTPEKLAEKQALATEVFRGGL